MSTPHSEIKVGAAVIAGLLILVCGLIWGRGDGGLDASQTFHVRFDDVKGLSKGDPVVVRGLKQGSVDAIGLRREYVDVTLRISSTLVLYDDASCRIEDREIMGGRQLSLDPGSSGIPADPAVPIPGSSSGMMQMMQQAEQLLLKADSLFTHADLILSDSRLRKLPARLEDITVETAGMIRENRENLRRTAERIEAITRRVEQDSLNTRAVQLIDNLDQLVTVLDSTAASSRRVVQRLDSRQGSAGNLIHDRELYDNLLRSTANLDSLIVDIRKHPGKYFKVSLF